LIQAMVHRPDAIVAKNDPQLRMRASLIED
jgi:hypothetical protein